MATTSINSFVDDLRRHKLLEAKQLEELAGDLRMRFPNPKKLSLELQRRGWLTSYQMELLLQGQGQNLVLGGFVILERLGSGGMGQVFKARQRNLGRIVALKVIHKERLENPDAIRRFQREVRAAAALSHPNIVLAYDADQIGDTHLLVMEHIDGATDLKKLVAANGPVPVTLACEYIRQAAQGLQHAYERGMVHRDIKPANLLLSRARTSRPVGPDKKISSADDGSRTLEIGQIKILDMGLARLDQTQVDEEQSATITREGMVMGTPDYMAPEQIQETHTVDIRADLYALGCTFYYLLAGHPPFPTGTFLQKLYKHQYEKPPPIEQFCPGVPAGVAHILRKLLAKKPADRFQTPAELIAALASHDTLVCSSDTIEAAKKPSPVAGEPAAPEADRTKETLTSALEYFAKRGDTMAMAAPMMRPRKVNYRPWFLVTGVAASLIILLVLLFTIPKEPPEIIPIKHEVKPPEFTVPAAGKSRYQQDANWHKQVAAKAPELQVEAVAAKLKDRNPGFNGLVEGYKIEGGAVTELRFLTDNVRDLSPVRALPHLHTLYCDGNLGKGKLDNLAPLEDMKLTNLSIADTDVFDLSPLKDLKLKELIITRSQVADLRPLKDMKLTMLRCDFTKVADLSPLKDMNLTYLNCEATNVSDLSPIRGMPLKELRCDPRLMRDIALLRSIPTLEMVNQKPWAEFLKDTDARKVAFDSWLKAMATLPAEKQADAVTTQLVENNPGFNGIVLHQVENGVVTSLEFLTDNVIDLSPLRALTGLRTLKCYGTALNYSNYRSGKGQLADLGPLKDLKLDRLECYRTKVSDLSPLQGMNLKRLHIAGTYVADLAPLKGMNLEHLDIGFTPIADLTPLKGMQITTLYCMGTQVADLSPLQDMNLGILHCSQTRIADLTPISRMTLKDLVFTVQKNENIDWVRSIKTLERINYKSAAEFWMARDPQPALEEQVRTVVAQLQALNPGFDGKVKAIFDGGEVTSLEFYTDRITDISPVRALTGLRILKCYGSSTYANDVYTGKGTLADLSPLKTMKLTQLWCYCNEVTDLTPLRGMPLKDLKCYLNPVSDLAPLQGMPLTSLDFSWSQVADMTPVADMKLTFLHCHKTKVPDLGLLRNMPLEDLFCDCQTERDFQMLRSFRNLERINEQLPPLYWQQVAMKKAQTNQ